MDCCKKFIFIQEDNSLVIELSSTIDEISIFYYGICRCVFEQGVSVEQPMKITNDAKDKIVNFLHHRYSKDKRINKLIQFFRNIGNDQYIYFYPYNNEEKTLEMYDVLEKSLVYYNQGCCQEEIACKIGDYISELSFAKDMLNSMPYTITIIVPGKKVIVGERDKSRRKCIYCGGTQVEENASFKEKAHAIPEALGNKNFIQNEECDICNEYFAENAEEDFSNMLVFNRLKYGLKGKNGYPIFQFGSKKYARFFDWEEEDYENMMLASSLAGMAIAHTGTSLPHGMSYYLTYHKGIPHGKAVGYFLPGYLRLFAEQMDVEVMMILRSLGIGSLEQFEGLIRECLGTPEITDAEKEAILKEITSSERKLAAVPIPVTREQIAEMITN